MIRLFAACSFVVAACGFEHGQGAQMDAPPMVVTDGAVDGVMVDASKMVDARICPPAPAGCTSFTCSSTSSCYYLCGDPGKATWGGAKGICEGASVQGCIATIDDMAEQNCITAATLPTNSNPVWVGYRQDPSPTEPAGNWKWECGTSTYAQPGWADFSGQPDDNNGAEDCLALAVFGFWTDADCTGTARYLCEVP